MIEWNVECAEGSIKMIVRRQFDGLWKHGFSGCGLGELHPPSSTEQKQFGGPSSPSAFAFLPLILTMSSKRYRF